jgi:acetyltransferase-like isoleucine patch superfamily enzyme
MAPRIATIMQAVKNLIWDQMRICRSRLFNAYLAASVSGSRIDPKATIYIGYHGRIELSDGVTIGAYTFISIESDPKFGNEEESILTVGSGTYIGEHNNIRAVGKTRIGRRCLISQGVSIIGANHSIAAGIYIQDQPLRLDKVGMIIGDDVWIGCNSVLLPGISIGDGAVIAAGSVVNCNVEPGAIVAGVPARLLRYRT